MQSNLTKEKVREFFRAHDKSKDGYLDINEMKNLYKELCQKHNSRFNDAQVNNFIKKIDKDRDGRINEDEFVSIFFPQNKVQPKIEQEVLKYFKEIDRNNDGYIDRAELANALLKVGKLNGISYTNAEKDGMFRYYDVNGDGKIKLEEFASLHQ